MKNSKIKKELLNELKTNPIISSACSRVGVPKSTFYRWCKNNDFKQQVDTASAEGRATWNDVAESQLISAIKQRSMSAIKYWLDHNHEKYSKRMVEISGNLSVKEELTPEQEALIKKALALAGLSDEAYGNK